jgi:hypothetical protein
MGAGRPLEPGTFGTDEAALGRDPVGKDSARGALKPTTPYHSYKGRTPLSPSRAEGKRSRRDVLRESLRDAMSERTDPDDAGTILDENRLLRD